MHWNEVWGSKTTSKYLVKYLNHIQYQFYEILYSGSIDETDSSDDDILPTNPQTCEIIKQKIVRVVTGGYGGAAMAATFKSLDPPYAYRALVCDL